MGMQHRIAVWALHSAATVCAADALAGLLFTMAASAMSVARYKVLWLHLHSISRASTMYVLLALGSRLLSVGTRGDKQHAHRRTSILIGE